MPECLRFKKEELYCFRMSWEQLPKSMWQEGCQLLYSESYFSAVYATLSSGLPRNKPGAKKEMQNAIDEVCRKTKTAETENIAA